MTIESRTVSVGGASGGRWSDYALDTFFGPHLSELTAFDAPDVPEMSAYILSFGLNRLMGRVSDPRVRASLILSASFIQHVGPAIIEYREACRAAREYVAALPNQTRLITHALAVARFEHCIFQASNAQTYLSSLSTIFPEIPSMFNRRDDKDESDHARLNRLGNRIRHFHEDVASAAEKGAPDDIPLAPIWISNDGVCGRKNGRTISLTFVELAALLIDFTASAKTLAEGPIPEP